MAMMSGLPSLLADMPPLQIGHARNDRIRSQILQVLLLFLVHEMLEGVPPIPSFCKTEGAGGRQFISARRFEKQQLLVVDLLVTMWAI